MAIKRLDGVRSAYVGTKTKRHPTRCGRFVRGWSTTAGRVCARTAPNCVHLPASKIRHTYIRTYHIEYSRCRLACLKKGQGFSTRRGRARMQLSTDGDDTIEIVQIVVTDAVTTSGRRLACSPRHKAGNHFLQAVNGLAL
ncbi:hypothetical protein EVAR_90245_1 [Eumeta japonica]|uniref:Uncharacterized protein n=1 Tax=Eumeta variegata TaxID=151549 RepID=A0A4C1YSI3_EUMVA|nr:hypothetical protein EVAR_90245_1 [Eumeta japonica]